MTSQLTSAHAGELLDFSQLDAYVDLEADWSGTSPHRVAVEHNGVVYGFPVLIEDFGGIKIARSPYGYPGPAAGFFVEGAIQKYLSLAAAQGWVATYLRCNPLLDLARNDGPQSSWFLHESGTVGVVELDDRDPASLLAGYSKNLRRDIARGARDGLQVRIVALRDGVDRFAPVYAEAMERLGSRSSLRYDLEYFVRFAEAIADAGFFAEAWLDDTYVAGCILVVVGARAQYHLSAGRRTSERASEHGMKVALHEGLVEVQRRGGRTLNLGGGLGGADDGLWKFKRRFASHEAPYLTLRAVADPAKFERVFGRSAGSALSESPFPPPPR